MSTDRRAILIVDADPRWEEVRGQLSQALQVEAIQATTAVAGRELLKERFFFLAILAESLPGADSMILLAEIKQGHPLLPVIILSSSPSVPGAVGFMREGAQDYLESPLTLEQLREILIPYLWTGWGNWSSSRTGLPGELERPIITQEPVMLRLLKMAAAVAPAQATVLIQGESGTGKELLARYIHAKSDRAQGPFIAVNCASLPSGLLESELFGHEKGAFTGAITRKLGKFELAQNGTLLLDEISEFNPHLQAKLLRVLQENEIERVGGCNLIPLNIRVIVTTNQDLAGAIQEGRFREDLFYRLQVICLNLPPLRARRGDIPLLAQYFLQQFSRTFDKGPLSFTPATLAVLKESSWPGNVRELENAIARGVLLAEGPFMSPQNILSGHLPGEMSPAPLPGKEHPTLKEMEQRLIFQALDRAAGNRTHAATKLGISVRTLRNKLHEYRATADSRRTQAPHELRRKAWLT